MRMLELVERVRTPIGNLIRFEVERGKKRGCLSSDPKLTGHMAIDGHFELQNEL